MRSPIVRHEVIHGYRLILGYIGVLLMIIGTITMLPLLSLLFYPQDVPQADFFLLPGIVAITVGYLLFFLIRGKDKGKLARNQDAIIVVGCWILAVFVTAMPFYLSGHYNFTQSIFEATSGWSTTGLSVVDVDHTSHLFLIHRSCILFFGGIGLVLIMLSVLSDTFGMRLYNAEGHNDRLLPNLLKSARIIITIYSCYIVAGIILYMLFGMSLFDAFIHSIGALSTGGFSSHSQSIAYFHSVPIEIITMVLMILGNINFLAHLFLLRRKFRHFFHYCEITFQFILIALATPILVCILTLTLGYTLSASLTTSLFQIISALTTTGFQTVKSFQALPASILLILIVLQLIGGGIGSTAGGIKQFRVCLLLKSIGWHIQSMMHSHKTVYTHKIYKVERQVRIDHEEIAHTSIYVFLYICIFFTGSFLLTLWGYPLKDCMFDFSSALSTVGLSTGIMSAHAPNAVLWIGTIGMFIGRLEIYVVLLAILRFGNDVLHHKHKRRQEKSAIIGV